jgi:hypothetical protein
MRPKHFQTWRFPRQRLQIADRGDGPVSRFTMCRARGSASTAWQARRHVAQTQIIGSNKRATASRKRRKTAAKE